MAAVMSGMLLAQYKSKFYTVTAGCLISIFIFLAGLLNDDLFIRIGFIAGHIVVLAMFLFFYYMYVMKAEPEDLPGVFLRYVKIPAYIYIFLIGVILCGFAIRFEAEDTVAMFGICLIEIAACIYTFLENRKLDRLSGSLQNLEHSVLKQYIYQKNALTAIYCFMFSVSMGVFYIYTAELAEDGAFVFIFVLEEFFVMLFYRYFYRKIVVKFMPEDDAQYSKWQLFVPKRIGIGWTFNFNCPLTYIILGGICIAMAAAAL